MDLRDEGELVEFKQEVGAGAIKTIIAFVNTLGGTLYIGIANDGSVIGVENTDAELTRLASMMRDSIRPDVLMNVSYGIETLEGKRVIVVRVARGVKRPYYLASKGPRPEGVFIRSGASSVPASETSILRMIQETEGDAFETRPSLRQDLTFEYARSEFAKKGLALGGPELRTLGAAYPNGAFTNLGLLLSDQCPPTVKAAQFSDDARNVFVAREEYSGSVLRQLADAYGFLERNNRFRTGYRGLERVDHYDVPPVALREALVNSVAHREYALSGPTLVSAMPSGVEIVSPGGLPVGIEEADMRAHLSIPRNRGLAGALYRLGVIEAYGTGIGRMFGSYKDSGVEPALMVTPNSFTAFLPNRNVVSERGQEPLLGEPGEVLALLAEGPKTRSEVQGRLGVSQTAAIRLLRELSDAGKVVRLGGGRSTRYMLTDESGAR